ncbi:MAG: hypothetical protein DMG27_22565, partial [Acidobacteria bacterium]
AYGQALLARLAADLAGRFGRGFSERNLGKMRLFYLSWKIPPTLTAKSPDAVITDGGKAPTASAKSVPIVGIKPEALEAEGAPLQLAGAISSPLVPLRSAAVGRKP